MYIMWPDNDCDVGRSEMEVIWKTEGMFKIAQSD
jgi:hypothetical protein